VFRIEWGDPLAAAALVLCADAAAASAGVLLGAVGRNPDRTTAMAPIVAVGLAVVGGCVIPLELFPASLVTVAHGVPHFWAVRGWEALLFDGARIGDIAIDLLVLAAVAVGLMATAMVLFRRQLGRTPASSD
jgi:ABC-2 type transport system permease protein